MKTGILLINIGSPDQPTTRSVARFLRKFLSDKRVVKIPRIIWLPILYGIILPFRSKQSAKLYQKIWTQEGSPLTVISKQLAGKLQNEIQTPVEIGMLYSNPSIKQALSNLKKSGITKLIILPLFPQYSESTSGAALDAVTHELRNWKKIPELHFIHDYANHPTYIESIATSIQNHWEKQGKPEHLLFSFHGLPQKICDDGDPYFERCKLTANLIADKLSLSNNFWSIAFQSRLGKAKWLSPYTDSVLKKLPKENIKTLDVICPGFAVDCLETLEEILIRGKKQFEDNGGKSLRYIPALNANTHALFCIKNILF